jgi:hypothetical protein
MLVDFVRCHSLGRCQWWGACPWNAKHLLLSWKYTLAYYWRSCWNSCQWSYTICPQGWKVAKETEWMTKMKEHSESSSYKTHGSGHAQEGLNDWRPKHMALFIMLGRLMNIS